MFIKWYQIFVKYIFKDLEDTFMLLLNLIYLFYNHIKRFILKNEKFYK